MTDDCEIENRIDDRRRALRHLTRAIDELELAGCDRLRERLEVTRSELAEITPVSRGARLWRAHKARVDSGGANGRSRLARTQRRSAHLWNF